jgi:hypothetical protein
MTALLPTNGLATGPYIIRVTNTDENTWGDWSLFVVTQPSGKLDDWNVSASTLVTGRRTHAGVAGRINNASRFLYVIGGDTGSGGAALDTVEVIPLDIFGDLGTPFEQRYKLNAARAGVAAVQQGGYIYAIGGSSDLSAPLGSIERAKILSFGEAPVVQGAVVNGTLDAGAWYYKVAAVLDSTDPDNPDGETLPSDELVISLGQDGGVELMWAAVPGAVSYVVYRSEMVDGQSTTEVFLDQTTGTTYVDDGNVTPDPTRTPLAPGSTGVWVTLSDTLVAARQLHEATIASDPNGQAYVYVVGGFGMCDAMGVDRAMDCYEYATLSTDGTTLGSFSNVATGLDSARFRLGLAVGANANSSQITDPDNWLFATGGDGLAASDSDAEALQVTAGGTLGAPQLLEPNQSSKMSVRGGHALQLANNALYQIGGETNGTPADSTDFSVDFSTVPFRNSFSSASVSMSVGRWEHVVILESGFFYAIGGSTDNALSNADATIDVTIY